MHVLTFFSFFFFSEENIFSKIHFPWNPGQKYHKQYRSESHLNASVCYRTRNLRDFWSLSSPYIPAKEDREEENSSVITECIYPWKQWFGRIPKPKANPYGRLWGLFRRHSYSHITPKSHAPQKENEDNAVGRARIWKWEKYHEVDLEVGKNRDIEGETSSCEESMY